MLPLPPVTAHTRNGLEEEGRAGRRSKRGAAARVGQGHGDGLVALDGVVGSDRHAHGALATLAVVEDHVGVDGGVVGAGGGAAVRRDQPRADLAASAALALDDDRRTEAGQLGVRGRRRGEREGAGLRVDRAGARRRGARRRVGRRRRGGLERGEAGVAHLQPIGGDRIAEERRKVRLALPQVQCAGLGGGDHREVLPDGERGERHGDRDLARQTELRARSAGAGDVRVEDGVVGGPQLSPAAVVDFEIERARPAEELEGAACAKNASPSGRRRAVISSSTQAFITRAQSAKLDPVRHGHSSADGRLPLLSMTSRKLRVTLKVRVASASVLRKCCTCPRAAWLPTIAVGAGDVTCGACVETQ
jgi:hypothetical protein